MSPEKVATDYSVPIEAFMSSCARLIASHASSRESAMPLSKPIRSSQSSSFCGVYYDDTRFPRRIAAVLTVVAVIVGFAAVYPLFNVYS